MSNRSSLDALYGPSRPSPRPIAGPGMPPQEAPIGDVRETRGAGNWVHESHATPRKPNILMTPEQLVAQALLMGKAIERLKAENRSLCGEVETSRITLARIGVEANRAAGWTK